MPTDPDDEVSNQAGTRYAAKLVPRSLPMKSAAWIGNVAISLISRGPETLIPSQDKVVVVDSPTKRIVLKRGGTDVPASEILNELPDDLKGLSIRQFRTKWSIDD